MSYNPIEALIFFLIGSFLFLLIVWPEWGLWFRLRKIMRNNKRIMMEDALKEMYECERNEQEYSIKSLAGSLAISSDQMAVVLKRLSELHLTEYIAKGFRLSESGREYALRIIRIHRLWEQYLAEKTGVPEISWHTEADKLEHDSSEDQMNEINHILGYPRYDPHGDPIPTESGELPPSEGVVLTNYTKSIPAVIIHIEDEPKSIYEEIINKNIHIGMILERVSENNDKITIKLEGRIIVLSKITAANITVREEEEKEKIDVEPENLTMLAIGEKGEVVSISKACRGPQRRRLMDLGVLPGTVVSAEMKGLGGDPTAFNIRGAKIALRRDTAEMIQIKRFKEVA